MSFDSAEIHSIMCHIVCSRINSWHFVLFCGCFAWFVNSWHIVPFSKSICLLVNSWYIVSTYDVMCLHQSSHRLEKYLNMKGFLEKSLKIKSALKSIGESLLRPWKVFESYCFLKDLILFMEAKLNIKLLSLYVVQLMLYQIKGQQFYANFLKLIYLFSQFCSVYHLWSWILKCNSVFFINL